MLNAYVRRSWADVREVLLVPRVRARLARLGVPRRPFVRIAYSNSIGRGTACSHALDEALRSTAVSSC